MNTEKNIKTIFNLLRDWIKLPGYQAERRLDVFFGLYLETILKNTRPCLFGDKDIIQIIPEFPLEKKKVIENDKDLSYSIDYLVVNHSKKTIHAIELKTDNSSVCKKQINYYVDFLSKETEELLTFIDGIIAKPKHHKKYENLYSELETLRKGGYSNNGVIYLIPKEKHSKYRKTATKEKLISNGFDVITFGDMEELLKEESANDRLLQQFLYPKFRNTLI